MSNSPEATKREAIRILVQDIGYTKAAEQLQIKRDTLYKWGQRYGWKVTVQHAQASTVQSVQSPADAHAAALAEMESETRLSLARSARRMAKQAEKADLRNSPDVHNVAKTMAIVHKQDQGKGDTHFTLNTLNINSLNVETGETTSDS